MVGNSIAEQARQFVGHGTDQPLLLANLTGTPNVG